MNSKERFSFIVIWLLMFGTLFAQHTDGNLGERLVNDRVFSPYWEYLSEDISVERIYQLEENYSKEEDLVNRKLLAYRISELYFHSKRKIKGKYWLDIAVNSFSPKSYAQAFEIQSIEALGNMYFGYGRGDSAKYYFEKAIEIQRRQQDTLGFQYAILLTKIGSTRRFLLGESKSTEIITEQGEFILKKLQKSKPWTYLFTLNNYIRASSYRISGQYEKARATTFHILQYLDQNKLSLTRWRVSLYGVLGNIHFSLKNYDEALKYGIQGIQQSQKIYGKNSRKLAQKYINLANYCTKLNMTDSAFLFCEKALISGKGSPSVLVDYYCVMANIFEDNNTDSCYYYNRKSMILARNIGLSADFSRASRNLATIFLKEEKIDSAMVYVNSALLGRYDPNNVERFCSIEFDEFFNKTYLLFALRIKMKILAKAMEVENDKRSLVLNIIKNLENFSKAEELYRMNFQLDNSKIQLFSKGYPVYENALKSIYRYLKMYPEDEEMKEVVFEIMEKSKARLLLEGIDINNSSSSSNKVLMEIREINLKIAIIKNRFKDPEIGGKEIKKQETQANLFNLIESRSSLLKKIEEKERHTIQRIISFQNRGMDEYVSFLEKNALNVIEYFWGDNEILIFGWVDGRSHIHEIKITEKLIKKIQLFKMHLSRGINVNHLQKDYEEYCEIAYDLYEIFFAPFEQSTKEYLIIPDGELNGIPFEAMISERTKGIVNYRKLPYLIKKKTVNYGFSLQHVIENSNHFKSEYEDKSVFGFGYSSNLFVPEENEAELDELPGTAEELKVIQEYFDGDFYWGENATERAFKDNIDKHSIMHLALHNIQDKENSQNTHLVFKSGGEGEDGYLHNYELLGLHLDYELVVLSACETGVGERRIGDAVLSIGRGFSLAGSRSILFSLWNVNDRSTSEVMSTLYKELYRTNEICLRNSKLMYLEESDNMRGHPSNWAAFVGYKSYPLEVKFNWIWIKLSSIIIGIISLLVFYFKRKKGRQTCQPL